MKDAGSTCAVAALVALLGAVPAACAGRPHPTTSVPPQEVRAIGPDAGDARRGTGAVAALDAEALDGMRVTRVEELLQGRVAGVEVVRGPDGDFSVHIRGAQSFQGNDEPLYVVDGVPIRGRSLRNALGAVLPSHIARIEVLKDAAAAAAYGSQGASGVIVITTKRHE